VVVAAAAAVVNSLLDQQAPAAGARDGDDVVKSLEAVACVSEQEQWLVVASMRSMKTGCVVLHLSRDVWQTQTMTCSFVRSTSLGLKSVVEKLVLVVLPLADLVEAPVRDDGEGSLLSLLVQ